jgi:linoleoyl-CoA desaturase
MDVAHKFLDSLPQVEDSMLSVEKPVQVTSLGSKRDKDGLTLPTPGKGSGGFYAEVKQRVNRYFEETGKTSRGGMIMVVKSLVTLSLLATVFYASVVLDMWYCSPLIGVMMAICGLSIQHDANHGALTPWPRVNFLFGMVDDLIGGSSLAWRHQHVVAHHADPNDAELDPDSYFEWPLIRFNPALSIKPFHAWQHWYAPLLYSFMGIAYGVGDIFTILAGTYAHVQLHKMRAIDHLVFWGGKIVHFSLFYGLPLYLHGWQHALLCIIIPAQLTGGCFLASTFAVSHNSTGAAYNLPREMDFGELQTRTAVNWSVFGDCPDSIALFWLLVSGGLNYQIEHHLFPGVAHIHYPAISRIVRQVCEEYGVPYNAYSTFADIYKEHLHTLYLLGTGQDDQVASSLPRGLPSCKSVEGEAWSSFAVPGEATKRTD